MKRSVCCIAVFALAVMLSACARKNGGEFQGWVEADLIFVSPDEQGRVETMAVREGDNIAKDALLFTLDSDLQKADVGVAQATLTNTRQAFDRAQQLAKTGAGTQRDYDVSQAALREAEARFASAQTRLARRRLASPVDGIVQQVYFRPGETVPASRPIIAMLPPGNIKIRFFVPEALLPRVAIGDKVKISCDGCTGDLDGTVTFISNSAEFTPPVIYSLEERSKLVYLVEARPQAPSGLRVGQPVSVNVALHEAAK